MSFQTSLWGCSYENAAECPALLAGGFTHKILVSCSELRPPNSQLSSERRVGEEDGDRCEKEEDRDQDETPTVGIRKVFYRSNKIGCNE